MKSPPRSVWYWRYLLILGLALAVGFLIDGKFLLLVVALIWTVAMLVALARIRRQRV
jgi:hypothetical protein